MFSSYVPVCSCYSMFSCCNTRRGQTFRNVSCCCIMLFHVVSFLPLLNLSHVAITNYIGFNYYWQMSLPMFDLQISLNVTIYVIGIALISDDSQKCWTKYFLQSFNTSAIAKYNTSDEIPLRNKSLHTIRN